MNTTVSCSEKSFLTADTTFQLFENKLQGLCVISKSFLIGISFMLSQLVPFSSSFRFVTVLADTLNSTSGFLFWN